MKYSPQQKQTLKQKGLERFKIHRMYDPIIRIKDGFFIYENKMNKL